MLEVRIAASHSQSQGGRIFSTVREGVGIASASKRTGCYGMPWQPMSQF